MLRIYTQYAIPDARAKLKKKQFEDLGLKNKLGAVRLAECYTIDAKLNKKQIQKAKTLLANPLMQSADTALKAPRNFNFVLEIGFLPGVTDNVGSTARETLEDGAKIKFKEGQGVYSSLIYIISGKISQNDARKIALSLYNPLIQRAAIKSREQFIKDGGMDKVAPKVKLPASVKAGKIDLNISEKDLIKLGKLGVANFDGTRRGPLSLNLDYLIAIRDYFNKIKRQPTDVELETLAQTWSEHCKHTIFSDPMDEITDGLYRHYIKRATEVIRKKKGKRDFCVSVFTDNAGGINFDKNYAICHKVETHNTPSALDPFGGSITGIGGVNRDVLGFGLGAKPVANFYGFCLADPNDKTKLFRDRELTQPMLSARRIMDGVIAGINAGSNQSGIPTPLGFLFFDSRFRGKPLVFAGTLGLIPKKIGAREGWQKQAKPGDLIVMIGGRVGLDGIHGATFASEGLDAHSPAAAVQIGDPITQKKFSDAIAKEARDLNLYNSITDCGAGGLSSAVGEMAKEAGGCEVNLSEVPLKYPGLAPWQIWISESQERMVLAVPKNKWNKLAKLLKTRGVEASVIGEFINSGKCRASYQKKVVLDIDMEFLHNGRPKKHLQTEPPTARGVILSPSAADMSAEALAKVEGEGSLKSSIRDSSSDALLRMTPKIKDKNFESSILDLLSRLNITSYEFVSRQYDHEVQGSSALKPLQGRGRVNSEAAVLRPLLNSQKGAVLSYGLHPLFSEIDPYSMAACSIDSAIAAAVAAGANIDYLALLDNFCWCDPENPKRLWQLKQAARAGYDYSIAFGTPFISGKDSMYNDFKGYDDNAKPLKISIPPTLLISALGIIPDAAKTVSLDAKLPGDLLYILGSTDDEMGGSEYLGMIFDVIPAKAGIQKNRFRARGHESGALGIVPQVNAQKNLALYQSVFRANQNNLIASAISINRGGLAAGLCKTLMAGGVGAEISLRNLPGNWQKNYQALFSESRGRILATVDPKKAEKFEREMKGNIFARLGKITDKNSILIKDKSDQTIVKLKLSDAALAYKSTFKNY